MDAKLVTQEANVAITVVEALDRLPTDASRRRVLAFIGQHVAGEPAEVAGEIVEGTSAIRPPSGDVASAAAFAVRPARH